MESTDVSTLDVESNSMSSVPAEAVSSLSTFLVLFVRFALVQS
jgi:hypothetical protein